MESKIQSSFIPKKPVAGAAPVSPTVRYASSGVDVVMLVSIVMLVISLVLSAGVFLYQNLAVTDAEHKRKQLEASRESFNPQFIIELTKTSDKIRVAEGILEKHTAPSIFLDALEQDTLKDIQFIELEYRQKSDDRAVFKMKGKARNVNTVALQSSRFGDSTIIKDPIFNDIDLVRGGVVFSVAGEIDLNSIRYASVAALFSTDFSGGGGFDIFDSFTDFNQDSGQDISFETIEGQDDGFGQGQGGGQGGGQMGGFGLPAEVNSQ